jgi:SAM-dependent methyltransferase
MNLNALKKFAQGARRKLLSEVASRLDYVLGHDDAYVRAHQGEIGEIRRQLERKSREQLVEEVAYTWFNRIVALRYMDLRGYTKVRVVSPQAGQVQPELLFSIKQGRTPPEIRSLQTVFDGYLSGTIGSDQPDREIYTTALLGICNDYSRTLPFLFRKVDEYMAVLLPTDLLSESSILTGVQGAIGEDDVQDVEVIGWLYQFYISEKKDQVFGRPKGEKIKKEDIPAATQLFTPHWIVRYMAENSLGRLWRNNRPDTGLAEQMEYYIEGDPEPEFLTIEGPQEITLLDPACGSGHILTYAFDLLYGMYEETGYSAEEIPSLILTNNLYGIDIDTRAAELASFALTMKAREKDRFFFKRGVVPRVIAMEDVTVDLREADIRMSPPLQEAFGYLREATNFGSLIPVPAEVQGEIEELLAELDARGDADLFADQAMGQVRSGLRQLGYLARRYHCVVTNPPYLATANGNNATKSMLKEKYAVAKNDLFAAFGVWSLEHLLPNGYAGLMTPFTWMYIGSFSDFRDFVLKQTRILGVIQPEYHSFFESAYVPICSFVVEKEGDHSRPGCYVDLSDFYGADKQSVKAYEAIQNKEVGWRHDISQREFERIPGKPLAFTVSARVRTVFKRGNLLRTIAEPRQGIATANNDRYLRLWPEISLRSSDLCCQSQDRRDKNARWFRYQKGGPSRRWYGNHSYLINWEQNGKRLRADRKAVIRNPGYFFRRGMSWTELTIASFSGRYCPEGFIFDSTGPMLFPNDDADLPLLIGFLNSKVATSLLRVLSPTMHFSQGPVSRRTLNETETRAFSQITKERRVEFSRQLSR